MRLRYPSPPLADDRVLLRPWQETDLDCVEQASRDPAITTETSVPERFTPAEGLAFVHRQGERLEAGVGISQAVVDLQGGQAVGLAILVARPQPEVAGIGYWVVPAARGQGLGRRAVRLLSSWALDELGVERVEAFTRTGNLASQRALEAAGFVREGVRRGLLRDADGTPADGVVLARLRGS